MESKDIRKTHKINLGEKDLVIETPEDIERNEAYALLLDEYQEQLISGNVQITKRIWPCLYCNKDFSEQAKLFKHVKSKPHIKRASAVKGLRERLEKGANS